MVMEPEAKITMTDWSTQTNWTVSAGSLKDCITFESSLSSLNDGGDEAGATTVDSTPKSPLILCPSSSDSGPCEIKINFSEKHELMQVYVRSTARVYEIYSEPNQQSGNEYFCTVRCGIAARDGEVLHALNLEDIVSSHNNGFNKELAEENNKSEDDWVDVEVSDSHLLEGESIGSRTNSSTSSAKSSQDLFEATAEITDANPCTSVTLRLLSLQDKGCVCVDEIYVFADPVAPADSESQESHAENSSSSSLMAMFLPTMMQLSKTTGLSRINENNPPVRKEKQYFSEVDLGKAHPSNSVIKTQLAEKARISDQQEVKLQEVNEDSVDPSQTGVPLQDVPMESNHCDIISQSAKMDGNHSETPLRAAKMESNHGNSSCGNVERALEQLVSRMDRIEGICLGFQEKMLVPISSIESRLQQVEQQLETLTTKLQNSGLPSCSRNYNPDGSCIQSDANSCDNCHGSNVIAGTKSDKGVHIEVASVSPDDLSYSANTTQLHPGLVVTAPEFPDGEDEENNASGLERSFSNDKQRHTLSIDDAVASALAGFLSLSLETPRYTKSLTVRAPEFPNEDDHENENDDASPRALHEIEKSDSVHLKDSENIDCIHESTAHDIYVERGEKVNRDPNDKQSDEIAKETEDSSQLCSGKDDQDEVGVVAALQAEDIQKTDIDNTQEDNRNRKINGQISDDFSSISDIPELHQADSGSSSTTQGGLCGKTDLTDTVATEVLQKASHEDIIENVLGFSRGSSLVDFQTPILDVKFISQNNSATKPFLEALLVDLPETSLEHHHQVGESSDDFPVKEQSKIHDALSDVAEQYEYDLVSVDVNPETNDHFSVDKDYCTLINLPLDVGGDNLQDDHHKRSFDKMSASSSLI